MLPKKLLHIYKTVKKEGRGVAGKSERETQRASVIGNIIIKVGGRRSEKNSEDSI